MRYGVKPRYDRLRDLGRLTLDEIAQALTVHPKTVKMWAVHGLVRSRLAKMRRERRKA
jgi:DNA-directed RNA polymerase specialized sigma24 family protein